MQTAESHRSHPPRTSWSAAPAAVVLILACTTQHSLAADRAVEWPSVQREVAGLTAAYKFEKAIAYLSAYISENPTEGVAYEQRAWVTLDWLDLQDDFALADAPLRCRSISDPVTSLSNIEPPLEPRRLFLEHRLHERYAPPKAMKAVVADLGECKHLLGDKFDDRPIRAFAAEFVGKSELALSLVNSVIADGAATPRVYLMQSRILRTHGNLVGALTSADRAADLGGTRNQAVMRKISLLAQMNRSKEAVLIFDRLQDSNPSDARVLFARVETTHDPETAFRDLSKLMTLLPAEASPAYSLAVRDAQYKKDMKACIAHLDRAIELNPRSLLPYYARCNVRMKQGSLEGALADATAAIQCNPDFDLSYQLRSRVHKKLGDADAARQDDLRRIWLSDLYALHSAAARNPRDVDAAVALGSHYARGAEWSRALQTLSNGLKESPNHKEGLRQRARVCLAMEKPELALADASRLLEMDRDYGNYSLRGDVHAAMKNWDAAVRDYDNARCLDERLEQALRKRAAWHKAAGRPSEANADLERAGGIVQAGFVNE